MNSLLDLFSFGSGMTWSTLIFRSLLLVLIYWLLVIIQGRLRQGGLFGNYQNYLRRLLDLIMIFFEPAAALIIFASALRLNSSFALLLLIILLIAGYNRLQDYLGGILLRLNTSFAVGQQLKSPAANGTISKLRRLGAQLQTRSGQQFVPYSHLYRDGYTLESAEESTNFVTLELRPQQDMDELNEQQLLSRIASLPYLDDRHVTDVKRTSSRNQPEFSVRLALIEFDNLSELLALLNEWGYQYKILQK